MIMKDKGILKSLWLGMFILSALLGFVPSPEGANKYFLAVLGTLFFLPPSLLLYRCRQDRDRKNLILIRNLSVISLLSTVVLLVLNTLSLLFSEAVGDALYYVLVIVSAPMVCCQYWIIGLFGWAALLWCSLLFLKKAPK